MGNCRLAIYSPAQYIYQPKTSPFTVIPFFRGFRRFPTHKKRRERGLFRWYSVSLTPRCQHSSQTYSKLQWVCLICLSFLTCSLQLKATGVVSGLTVSTHSFLALFSCCFASFLPVFIQCNGGDLDTRAGILPFFYLTRHS